MNTLRRLSDSRIGESWAFIATAWAALIAYAIFGGGTP